MGLSGRYDSGVPKFLIKVDPLVLICDETFPYFQTFANPFPRVYTSTDNASMRPWDMALIECIHKSEVNFRILLAERLECL